MAKLTENSFRDVNIAFANELSVICDRLNIDIWELIRLANRHPRVNILQPGPGVGGHCIAVDPWFIVSSARDTAQIIRTAREVNDAKPEWVIDKVKTCVFDHLKENPEKSIEDVKIGFFGIAFKPNIDDLRESPAVSIVQKFINLHEGNVYIIEPHIDKLPESLSSGELINIDTALLKLDIKIVLVAHDVFKDNSLIISDLDLSLIHI